MVPRGQSAALTPSPGGTRGTRHGGPPLDVDIPVGTDEHLLATEAPAPTH